LITIFNINYFNIKLKKLIDKIFVGDWGLGIGDWGLGIGVLGPSPIPKNQNPIVFIKKN